MDLASQLRDRDPEGVWRVLIAAGASPGVRSRWTSVGHLLQTFVGAESSGSKRVYASQLPNLLAACHRDQPELAHLEDFMPADPRLRVLCRLGDDTFRMFPGQIERPVADINRAMLVADVADEDLRAANGFGIQDLLKVTMRHIDTAVRQMEGAWPVSDDRSQQVRLSEEELDAAAALLAREESEEDGLPAELEAALAWATCDAADLPYESDHPQSPFGRFLRIRRTSGRGRATWLPLAFLPEILGYAVSELAREAGSEGRVQRAFAQRAAHEVRRALWSFTTNIVGTDDRADGPAVVPKNTAQWIATFGPERAIVVQVVARLGLGTLPFDGPPAALAAVEQSHRDPAAAIRIALPGGAVELAPGTEVVPLLVFASEAHAAVPQNPGLPAMSLDDLRWAASSFTAPSDLFMYLRELSRPDRPMTIGWEAIDIWEWWLNNGKTLFSGGSAPHLIVVAPHAGEAEWLEAAKRADIEQALAILGLPPLRELDGVDHVDSGPPVVYRWTTDAKS